MVFQSHDNKGFTLIEVLVAMAIMAVAAMSLLNASAGQVSGSGLLMNKTIAGWVAENKAAEMQLAGNLPDNGTHDERVTMAGREWAIKSHIQSTPVAGLKRVDIAVAEPGELFQKESALVTLTAFIGTRRQAQSGATP